MTSPRSRPAPEELIPHYAHFRVGERTLLTGHSHQAWPDVGLEAQRRAWLDAAELVDDKWDAVFRKWERVARGFSALMGDGEGDVVLGSNTHELVVRFLSALPLGERPRIVTTDGEFHSIRRQLDRLAEEGIEVVKVPADPVDSLAERLAAQVDGGTAAVLLSAVLFETARIVPGLERVAAACGLHGVELLVDAYHALGVVPFTLEREGLGGAFVVGGGYKYLQLGEGNCFLRIPAGCTMRPVVTGWFSEFGTLSGERDPGRVPYGEGPARFAGSTFDPTSCYRGAAVMDFFGEQGLTPEYLRETSRYQVNLLASTFDALDLDPRAITRDRTYPMESVGGFLALRCDEAARAAMAVSGLRRRGVRVDARGRFVRFGPAPYLTDTRIVDAMSTLGEVMRAGT